MYIFWLMLICIIITIQFYCFDAIIYINKKETKKTRLHNKMLRSRECVSFLHKNITKHRRTTKSVEYLWNYSNETDRWVRLIFLILIIDLCMNEHTFTNNRQADNFKIGECNFNKVWIQRTKRFSKVILTFCVLCTQPKALYWGTEDYNLSILVVILLIVLIVVLVLECLGNGLGSGNQLERLQNFLWNWWRCWQMFTFGTISFSSRKENIITIERSHRTLDPHHIHQLHMWQRSADHQEMYRNKILVRPVSRHPWYPDFWYILELVVAVHRRLWSCTSNCHHAKYRSYMR